MSSSIVSLLWVSRFGKAISLKSLVTCLMCDVMSSGRIIGMEGMGGGLLIHELREGVGMGWIGVPYKGGSCCSIRIKQRQYSIIGHTRTQGKSDSKWIRALNKGCS